MYLGKPKASSLGYWTGTRWEPRPSQPTSYVYQLLGGAKTTVQTPSLPEVIGSSFFEANTIIPTTTTYTRTVIFEAVLESSSASFTAAIDLYDVAGITNASVPVVITGSSISTTSVTPVKLTATIAGLASVTTSGILEARLSISDGSGLATCKSARLIVTWT